MFFVPLVTFLSNVLDSILAEILGSFLVVILTYALDGILVDIVSTLFLMIWMSFLIALSH